MSDYVVKSKIEMETGSAERNIQSLSAEVDHLVDRMDKLSGENAMLKKSLEKTERKAKDTGASFTDFAKRIGTSYLGLRALTTAGKAAFGSFLQMEAGASQVNYILGQSASVIDDFAKNQALAFAMSEKAAYQYAGVFAVLLKGITRDQSQNAAMTTQLLKTIPVIASKTGRTVQDVSERIRSGLLGNTEAIEDLGINVNVALLKTTDAFKRVAGDRSWEQLTFQEQQQIRLLGILEQSAATFGHELADNTMTQVQRMQANLENLKTTGGELLSSVLTPLIGGLAGLFGAINDGLKPILMLGSGMQGLVLGGAALILLAPKLVSFFTTMKMQTLSLSTSITLAVGGIMTLALFISSLANRNKEAEKAITNTNKALEEQADAMGGVNDKQEEAGDGGLMGIDQLNSLQGGGTDSTGTNADAGIGDYSAMDDYIQKAQEAAQETAAMSQELQGANTFALVLMGTMSALQLIIAGVNIIMKLKKKATAEDTAENVKNTASEKIKTAAKQQGATASQRQATAQAQETAAQHADSAANVTEATTQQAVNVSKATGLGLMGPAFLPIVTAAIGAGLGVAAMQLMPKTPAMASGGVVTAPTTALVGEGQYPEAVIPLGDSPQYQAMLDGIAERVAGVSRGGSTEVVVVLNGQEVARVLADDMESEYRRRGW